MFTKPYSLIASFMLACTASAQAADPAKAPTIGAEQEVLACDRLRAQARWRDGPPRCRPGADTQSCTYNPPPGWVLVSHRVVVHSSSNGSRSVSTLGEGLNFMSEVEMRDAYRSVLDAAARKGDKGAQLKIKDQYDSHAADVRRFRTNRNTLQAVASARSHGDCFDRKGGWEDISVWARVRYLGQPTRPALERELREQFGLRD